MHAFILQARRSLSQSAVSFDTVTLTLNIVPNFTGQVSFVYMFASKDYRESCACVCLCGQAAALCRGGTSALHRPTHAGC